MAPQRKLQIASALMLIGTAPLLLGVFWILAVIATAHSHKGQMGGSDGFLMIAVLIVTYAFAAVVAGLSALWSISTTNRNADLRSMSATILRIVVAAALLMPLCWYVGIEFRFL